MIRISNAQKQFLLDNGCKYHKDIHATHGHSNHTYATESERVMMLLKMYSKGIPHSNTV